MEFASYEDFQRLCREDQYYHSSRWDLYSRVQKLISEMSPKTILELGSYRLPLIVGSDTMDIVGDSLPTFVHDAGSAPWPIADQQYDLFIALQVWEHLRGKQQVAFREVQRIAQTAILSFPYRWNCLQKNPSHHGITEETISEWTEGSPPEKVIIVPSDNNHRRIIYLYDFEKQRAARSRVLNKNQTRTATCQELPATLRREPAECRYRTDVKQVDGGEVARCRFVEEQFEQHGEMVEAPVREDACQVCITEAEPTSACFNTVVSSLIFSKLRQLPIPQSEQTHLQKLRHQAENGLRLVVRTPRLKLEQDRTFGDCVFLSATNSSDLLDEQSPCQHPQHPIGSPTLCHLCPDHRSPEFDATQSLALRLPFKRTGHPVRSWMVGVTTSPRKVSTLDRTLDSIVRAGWSTPWLFLDSAVPIASRHAHLPVTYREARTGAWPNYYLALTEMYMRDPHADAYLMLQDDLLLTNSENLRRYLEEMLWPQEDVGVVSLFCSSEYHKEQEGWHEHQSKWVWGALAFIFSNKSAWDFLGDPEVRAHRTSSRYDGTRQIDVTIGNWILRTQQKILYPVPSLARHTGESSTLWEGALAIGNRQAKAFIR